MSGKLYLVGTPIGNLGDISPRCREILSQCDFIAAEDTRNTLKLLNLLGIKAQTVSYHEHNRASKGGIIIERILSGETCALVTDAGMPAISDPGEDLVRDCHKAGIEVVVIPGPCAAICALALSGIPSKRFAFEGFLPPTQSQRISALEALKEEERTLIFYEAPHRLCKTVADMYAVFGNRQAAFCKEITKMHEKTIKLTLLEALDYFDENVKGEFAIVVEGCEKIENELTEEQIEDMLISLINSGESVSSAVKKVSKETSTPKNAVYKIANRLNF